VVHAKEKPPINVVGDVAGHIAIVVVSILDINRFIMYDVLSRITILLLLLLVFLL